MNWEEQMKGKIRKILSILRRRSTVLRPPETRKTKTLDNSLSNIVAIATHEGLKTKNEDRVLSRSSQAFSFVILADGLGGRPHGEKAAQTAVDVFRDELVTIEQEKGSVEFGDMKAIYETAASRLRTIIKGKGGKTTLICIIERTGDFIISYLGDGQVYLMRGDTEMGIPLMITHRTKGLLGGTLGPEMTAQPVTMQISKAFRSGEIIVAGTDGVFNPEIGRVRPNLLIEFVSFFRDKYGLMPDNDILAEFLNHLHDLNLLEDNASLGLIITGQAREYMHLGGKR
jgi:hypothetical protein